MVRFQGMSYPVLVVIDGVPMNDPFFANEEFDCSSIQFMDVDHINVFHPSETVLLGARGSGGVIDITTKKGHWDEDLKKQKNSLVFSPLGYQREATFYSPAYATVQQKASPKIDLRTTLYWNPAIDLDGKDEATIEFYSADFATDYSIRVEGVSEGVIVEQEETVEIVE